MMRYMATPIKVQAHPLQWPAGWKTTPHYQQNKSRYKVTFASARDEVFATLRKMGATDIVLSTNVPVRLDGIPYANWREPDEPGAAVYWTRRGVPSSMACDSWKTVRENIRAIGVSLEAMHKIELAKAGEILERVYQGFAALPPATESDEEWRVLLRLQNTSDHLMTERVVRDAYIKRIGEVHPDRGGSDYQAVRVNKAYEAAKEWLAKRVAPR